MKTNTVETLRHTYGNLQRRFGDLFGRLMQPGVDDFKAMVAQGSRNGLCAPIVAVETWLGNNNAIGPLHKK